MMVETQLADERAKKTMIDTARLAGTQPVSWGWWWILAIADELRAEQENASSCEKNRRALEFKVGKNHNQELYFCKYLTKKN